MLAYPANPHVLKIPSASAGGGARVRRLLGCQVSCPILRRSDAESLLCGRRLYRRRRLSLRP